MSIYSKKVVEKKIEDRVYKIKKLGARQASIEGFRIIKAITPSLGVGMDSLKGNSIFEMTSTTASAFQFLSDNLEIDHYSDLVDKLLGSMEVNGVPVQDWSDHFDEEDHEGDFLEILFWAFKESLYGFFTKSTILKPWISKVKETVLPIVKEKIQNSLTDLSTGSNDESQETEKSK